MKKVPEDLKPHEFKEWLADEADAFGRAIELEVEAFPTDPEAQRERLDKIRDKKTGFAFFSNTYFPHYQEKENSKLHNDLDRDLPAMVYDKKGKRKIVIAPRGSAKSTKVSLMFVLYCVVLKLKHFPVIIMDAFEQAALAIEAIKSELEINPRLAQDFPDVVGRGRKWREGHIVTKNKIRIEGFGTGKKIRGRRHGPHRPDLIILDDIENDENVKNPDYRKKQEDWVDKTVLKLGPTDGSADILFAGTVINFDAVIVRFAKRPDWTVTRYQAIMRWPDNMELWEQWEEIYRNEGEIAGDTFYEENKAEMDKGVVLNWPANHTILFLMKERASSHSAFASEYQNKPISENNGFQKLIFWAKAKANLITFGAIDPSLGKQSKGRDPSAIIIGGVDPVTKQMDVLRASIRKRLPDVIITDAIQLQREFGCMLWFVETVQFQEFLRTSLAKEAVKQNTPLYTMPVIPFTDKILRIERLQMPVGDGQIRFHASQSTLIDQLQQFPDADHDDGPDTLEMLYDNAIKYCKGGRADIGNIQGASANGDEGLDDYRLGAGGY